MTKGVEAGILEWRPTALDGPHMDSRAFIAAAAVCGYEFAGEHPVDDYLDAGAASLEDFAAILQSRPADVRRIIRAAYRLDVAAIFGEEKVDIYEFRRRFESDAWCSEHPDHPISYLRGFINHLSKVNGILKGSKPRIRIKKGKTEAYLLQETDARHDPARLEQALQWFSTGIPRNG
jgi:hypothetical protein